jgi:hypothetical protein
LVVWDKSHEQRGYFDEREEQSVPTRTHLRYSCLSLAIPFAVLLMTLVLQSPSALAQSGSASLFGRVTDQENLVMPDVEVEIKNVDTGITQLTKTNGEGMYIFPSLQPGHYLMNVRRLSFRAVSVTGITLNVQDNLSRNFVLQVGSSTVSITVTADSVNMNTTNASVSTVIDRNFVESLPLNGRSFNTLLQLTPGVVIAPIVGNAATGQFSISGQRADANNFLVDGVSTNFGVSPTLGITASGTGGSQAFSALGGTSSLISVDALQEFRIETSSFAPEFGKTPGGQVILTTRSGTNDFHGAIFDYFRNTVMDANDWFANEAGLPRAPEHHNDFGGVLGGPIWKDRTFFFFSYEGARLILPTAQTGIVPSDDARTGKTTPAASAAILPFLNASPKPNGPVAPDDFTAQFTGNASNSATLNATSIRLDHIFNSRFSVFGRYNDAPSQTVSNGLSELDTITTNTRTLTVGLTMLPNNMVSNTLRGNYSTQRSSLTSVLSTLGGAVPLDPKLLIGSLSAGDAYAGFTTLETGSYFTGPNARNRTTQLNFVDDLAVSVRSHQLRFGGDYRTIFLDANPSLQSLNYLANSVQDFVSTGTASLSVSTLAPARILAQSLSLYAQDTWRVSSRLTMTYGVRWELAPAPSARGTTTLASWSNINNPAEIALAPSGTPLWKTTYRNFAPRIGVAYALTEKGDLVFRAGGGMFYDLGVGSSADLTSTFPNSASQFVPSVAMPVVNITPFIPVISLQPPFGFVEAFSPNLKLPRSYQWNIALEKSFAGRQAVSVTYIGQAGRDLLRQEALFAPNSNFSSDFVSTQNEARSNYDALQLQYQRPVSARLQAILNYTWSHSVDNSSNDAVAVLSHTIISGANDYAASDFDIRHSFSGALTYDIPIWARPGPVSLLTRDWSLDTVIIARTGFPFNGVILSASPDPTGTAKSRPDLVPGQPFWIANAMAPGGKSLNPAAFSIPSTIRQGTEGRNDIPGFGLTQVDLSLGRKFSLTERVKLQFRADAFNLFNHPNFTNPPAFVEFGPAFLQSFQMLNRGLGGLNPLFQEGGPRSLQLSLKLFF